MPGKRGRPPKKQPELVDQPSDLLTSQQEVIDELRMSAYKFQKLLAKYPFKKSGRPGKINNRWHVSRGAVRAWWNYVQKQEMRHPDSRRMRPAEPPDLKKIKARGV